MINRIDLKLIATVWVKFLKSRLMPTTHTIIVSQERLVLLYAIVRGLPIGVGAIIEKEIRKCAMKEHKTIALLFFSLITNICLVSGVHTTAHDERLKNESALTTCTVERIAGESAAVPPEPVVVAGAKRVIEVEKDYKS